MTERIISAAIHLGGVIFSMPSPARHHSIVNNVLHQLQWTPPFVGEEGFLTSAGRFVNRVEAKYIATVAGQIRSRATLDNKELFSEDLW